MYGFVNFFLMEGAVHFLKKLVVLEICCSCAGLVCFNY